MAGKWTGEFLPRGSLTIGEKSGILIIVKAPKAFEMSSFLSILEGCQHQINK